MSETINWRAAINGPAAVSENLASEAQRLLNDAAALDARVARQVNQPLTRVEPINTVDAQTIDAFTNALARMGAGTPSLLEGTAYPLTRLTRNYMLMQSLYRSNWIARKIIDCMAEDMMKNGYSLTSGVTPKQIGKFSKALRKTQTNAALLRALKWGRLFGGSAALMIIKGHEGILNRPLDYEDVELDSFRGLLVFDRWSGIYPGSKMVDDVENCADFGLPEFYQITTQNPTRTFQVHASRILRFIGRDLPNWEKQVEQQWGISEYEVIYEELRKRDNTSWNIANLIFRANILAYKQPDLAQMLAGAGSSGMATQRLMAALQLQNQLISNQSMLILPEKGGLETHQYSFPGINDVYQSFMLDICGATEYPFSRLFGRTPTGLSQSNEGDEYLYHGLLSSKQERELSPQIDKLLPVIAMSTFGDVPEDLDYRWLPTRTLTNKEMAELATGTTTNVTGLFNAGIITQQLALQELKQDSDVTGFGTNITDEMIEEADDQTQQQMMMEGGMGGDPNDPNGQLALPPGEEEGQEEGGENEQGEPSATTDSAWQAVSQTVKNLWTSTAPAPKRETKDVSLRALGAALVSHADRRARVAQDDRRAASRGLRPLFQALWRRTQDADFNEGDHPRDDDGKFGSGGGSAKKYQPNPNIKDILKRVEYGTASKSDKAEAERYQKSRPEKITTLYRGASSGELKPQAFGGVFLSESKSAAAQYGQVRKYDIDLSKENFLDIDSPATSKIVREWDSTLESDEDVEETAPDLFMFPDKAWVDFLSKKGYTGTRVGPDMALFGDVESRLTRKDETKDAYVDHGAHPTTTSKRFAGLDVEIETKTGEVRRGPGFQVTLKNDYGYIPGTRGADGDELDCFLGPDEGALNVFIVHTKRPDTGIYDEDKAMLGFNGESAAVAAFLANYDERDHFDGVSTVPLEAFKRSVGQRTQDEFNEADHPRGEEGSSKGGQFVKKGEGVASSKPVEKKTFGGWTRTYQTSKGEVTVSKTKPVTRGASAAYVVSGDGKEKRFQLGVGSGVDQKVVAYLKKNFEIDDPDATRPVKEAEATEGDPLATAAAKKYALTDLGRQLKDHQLNNQQRVIWKLITQGEAGTDFNFDVDEIASQEGLKEALNTKQDPRRVVAFYLNKWRAAGILQEVGSNGESREPRKPREPRPEKPETHRDWRGERVEAAEYARREARQNQVLDYAYQVDPRIHARGVISCAFKAEKFRLNGRKHSTGGDYNPATGKIRIFPDGWHNDANMKGALAHEMQHLKFNEVLAAIDHEIRKPIDEARITKLFGYDDHTTSRGMLNRAVDDQMLESGKKLSKYARTHVNHFQKGGSDFGGYARSLAINECLAEVANNLQLAGEYARLAEEKKPKEGEPPNAGYMATYYRDKAVELSRSISPAWQALYDKFTTAFNRLEEEKHGRGN